MEKKVGKFTIGKNSNLKRALHSLEDNETKIVLVSDKENFVGLLTDGDIRRAILRGANLNDKITDIINYDPITAKYGDSYEKILSLTNEEIKHVPVINEDNKLMDLVSIPMLKKSFLSLNMDDITIDSRDNLKKAMMANEKGGLGIVIIVDSDRNFVGLLTDGDIRRAILKNISLKSPIKKLVKKSVVVRDGTSFKEICNLMGEKTRILPVLDNSGKIVRIITSPVSIILPTYNEKGNINKLVKEIIKELSLKEIFYNVLVIDDNSPDKTAEEIKKLEDKGLSLIVRKNDRGLATAIKTGIHNSSGEVLVFMDTDFNHNPRDIPRLLEQCDDYDIVIGSRFVKGGGMENAKIRWLFSLIFNKFCSLILGSKTKDNQSGFMAVKKSTLEKFDLDQIFQGYGDYSIRLLYYAKKKGLNIKEVSTIYGKREYGESKTQFVKHLLQYLNTVFKLRFNMD